MNPTKHRYWVFSLLAFAASTVARAQETIEFVSEHLPEIAMDNRYAGLPLWNSCPEPGASCYGFTAAYALTHSQTLAIDGPMIAASFNRNYGSWTLTGFLFFDALDLSSGIERRPLQVLFTGGVPYALPVAAEFTGLSGSAQDYGAGIAFRRTMTLRWLHETTWSAGLMLQEISLRDYSYNYRVLEGPDSGSTGTLDYDTTYRHLVPFAGLAWPRAGERWSYSPHVQFAYPIPRRGVVGHITGDGFDLRGDQDANGYGRHFGDPSVTIGFDVTYLPWNLTIDLGTAVSQYLVEPVIHEGIDHDLVLSFRWDGWPRHP